MVTARTKFLWRKLRSKYGVVGEVAGRYIAAGYSVRIGVKCGDLVFEIVASKGGQKLAIKVYSGSKTVSLDDIDVVKKASERIGARPVIVLYGRGARLSSDVVEKIDELGVSIKRIKP